jgi:hypothetical protein
MRNIYLLWASIRPDFIRKTAQRWILNCNHKERLYFKIIMANKEQMDEVLSYKIPNCEVSYTDKKPGYNFAITQLTRNLEVNDDDIVMLLSDDFNCPDGWDDYIYSKFETWNNALFLDDGYQNVNKRDTGTITLACMTFECLKKINKVVFSPNYFHVYSDNEAFDNLYQLGLLKDDRAIDNVTFKHEHYAFGFRKQDEYDKRVINYWNHDGNVYSQRKKMSVKQRLQTII